MIKLSKLMLLVNLVRSKIVNLKLNKMKTKVKLKELLKLREGHSRKVERRKKSKQLLKVRSQLQKLKKLTSKARISSLVKRMNSNPKLDSVREVYRLFFQLKMTRKLDSRKLLLKTHIIQPRIIMDILTCLLKRTTWCMKSLKPSFNTSVRLKRFQIMFLIPETFKDKKALEMHLLSTWRRTGSWERHLLITFAFRMVMDQLLSLLFPSSVTKVIPSSSQHLVTHDSLLIFTSDQRFSSELPRQLSKRTMSQASNHLKMPMKLLSWMDQGQKPSCFCNQIIQLVECSVTNASRGAFNGPMRWTFI